MTRTLLLVALLGLPPIVTIGYTEYRDQARYPRRFAEALPRKIYRGGRPTADDIRHLAEDKQIRTIICLTEEQKTADEKKVMDAVNELHLGFHRIPMPGDGRGDFESLDMAADAIANQQNWPVYFHCAAGKQRSNASWAAYRLKYGRWPIEQVLTELQQKYDLSPATEGELCEHLRRYGQWMEARRAMATSRPAMNPRMVEDPFASRP